MLTRCKNAKKMYNKSEATGSISFTTQGNALRRSANEKQKKVDKLLKRHWHATACHTANVTHNATSQTVHTVNNVNSSSSVLQHKASFIVHQPFSPFLLHWLESRHCKHQVLLVTEFYNMSHIWYNNTTTVDLLVFRVNNSFCPGKSGKMNSAE